MHFVSNWSWCTTHFANKEYFVVCLVGDIGRFQDFLMLDVIATS